MFSDDKSGIWAICRETTASPLPMYQGGFGIAGKDKLADALLLLGLHQLRGQQPLAAAGSPGAAGEGPAHAAHGPAPQRRPRRASAPSRGPAPHRPDPPPRARREPIAVLEARRAPPQRALTNPISERAVSDSGMRQVATYQNRRCLRRSCTRGVVREEPSQGDGRALPWSGGRRSHSECKEQENDAGRSQSAVVAAAEGGPERSVSCGCWLQVGARCSEGALRGDWRFASCGEAAVAKSAACRGPAAP